jgi:enolase-phosphatase E1
VKDVLFPYAEKHLKSYLERTWTHERTVAEVEAVQKQAAADKAGNLKDVPPVPQTDDRTALLNAVVENLLWNMAKDRKVEALKEIQGHIWEEGYSKGDLHSIVYPDAAHFFARLVDAGVRVAIYSSGSRDAQRLLFKHSDQGDLRSHISCYFDTKVGGKREAASYLEIVKSLGVDGHFVRHRRGRGGHCCFGGGIESCRRGSSRQWGAPKEPQVRNRKHV